MNASDWKGASINWFALSEALYCVFFHLTEREGVPVCIPLKVCRAQYQNQCQKVQFLRFHEGALGASNVHRYFLRVWEFRSNRHKYNEIMGLCILLLD